MCPTIPQRYDAVFFYFADPDRCERARDFDADNDWREFVTGAETWILQTFVRLRDAGYPVTLTSVPPRAGIVVVHFDQFGSFLAKAGPATGLTVVGVRADRSANAYADFEIVQNPYAVTSRRTIHIEHWPQPGLVPRDSERGETIRNLAFIGVTDNLHAGFKTSYWTDFIAEEGLQWRTVGGSNLAREPDRWNDYTDVDVMVALRPETTNPYLNKPSSKLINAWHAGVPAVLGPESAYRALRRSPLDFIEAHDVDAVKSAIRRLRAEPSLYRRMTQNGFDRCRDYTSANMLNRWAAVLFDEIPRQAGSPAGFVRRATHIGVKRRVRGFLDRLRPRHGPRE